MGVRGLQTYVEKHCPHVSQNVCIEKLIRDYKYETGINQPVIVVDGSSCLRPLYGDLDWVSGGQMKQYAEKLKFFVEQFTRLGVKLIFFYDGPTVNRKRATWVKRRMHTMENVYRVLDFLADGNATTAIDPNLSQLGVGINFLAQNIIQNVCGCEVYTSIIECDEEIVDYARKNRCFAILGQDSDYMIYEGDFYYLSITNLDVENMRTIYYNRWELANFLRIKPQDLPLLATLIGNDVISADDLKSFHRDVVRHSRGHFAKTYYPVLFPSVADYIRRLPEGEARLRSLPDVAHRMFGDRTKVDLLVTSLRSYSSVAAFHEPVRSGQRLTGWDRILDEAKYRHVTNRFPPMIYTVLTDLPYETSTVIEDYRRSDLKYSATALRPLRQRVYGVLLYEKPPGNGPQVVKELCMEGPRSLDEEKLVTPISPRAYHPGLLTLWTSNAEAVIATKWKLFVASISTKLLVEKVMHLPEHLTLPTLILCYLTEENILLEWEIDALLATAVVLEEYNTERIADLPTDPVSIRAIRIAPLYLRTASVINFLSVSCGSLMNQKYITPCTYFDGKLFQIKYQASEKTTPLLALCDNSVNLMEHFQKAKSVISSVK